MRNHRNGRNSDYMAALKDAQASKLPQTLYHTDAEGLWGAIHACDQFLARQVVGPTARLDPVATIMPSSDWLWWATGERTPGHSDVVKGW